MNTAHLLTLVALVGTFTSIAVGIFQYRKAQHWKRAEWVAQEMKVFFGQAQVQNALLMIDWGKRRIPLFPFRENAEDRYVEITDDVIRDALLPHEERQGFNQTEESIRDCFDCFLDGLERYESYVGAKLVTRADLEPYLSYWCYQITTAREGDPKVDRLVQLRKYITRYGYLGANRLIRRLAHQAQRRRLESVVNH